MFLILSISEASLIAEILAFLGQLSIVYPLFLQLNHLPIFMSHDVSMSEFRGVGVIVPQSVLNRREKEVLLLDIVGAWEELVTAFRGILATVRIIVENLAFSLI